MRVSTRHTGVAPEMVDSARQVEPDDGIGWAVLLRLGFRRVIGKRCALGERRKRRPVGIQLRR